MQPIYLASSSPRRQKLLQQINLPFIVLAPQADETVAPNLTPAQQVQILARRKAQAAANTVSSGVIIAADTVVAIKDQVLGKPKNHGQALDMLLQLQGTVHQVYTGVTVLQADTGQALTDYETTSVFMSAASPQQLDKYVKTSHPMDKAGAYGIQGLAAVFITGISGCYFNVVGLPLFKLVQMLREIGIEVTCYWG